MCELGVACCESQLSFHQWIHCLRHISRAKELSQLSIIFLLFMGFYKVGRTKNSLKANCFENVAIFSVFSYQKKCCGCLKEPPR